VLACDTAVIQTNKTRYLKITCGENGEQPVRLDVFVDAKSAAKEKSKVQEILFHAINDLRIHEDRSINLKSFNGTELWFRAKSDDEQEKWIQFCALLYDLPYYFIPQKPNYNLVPRNIIARYDDPTEFNAGMFEPIKLIYYYYTLFHFREHLGGQYHP